MQYLNTQYKQIFQSHTITKIMYIECYMHRSKNIANSNRIHAAYQLRIAQKYNHLFFVDRVNCTDIHVAF